jgi:hypothetical protein
MASITLTVIRCIDYLAYGTILTRAMFVSENNRALDVFFAKKAQDECWELVRRETVVGSVGLLLV